MILINNLKIKLFIVFLVKQKKHQNYFLLNKIMHFFEKKQSTNSLIFNILHFKNLKKDKQRDNLF